MRVIKMNKELKQRMVSFLYNLISDLTVERLEERFDINECQNLLEQLSRKRGRVKGKKYPKKVVDIHNTL